MFYVRARASGPWRAVDVVDGQGNKVGERILIMVLEEEGNWCVDNRSVAVEPGLVLSFRDESDAMWFVNQRRAQLFAVEPGTIVVFESEADADFFVRKALGELLSRNEVEQLFAEAKRQQDMHDQRLGNPADWTFHADEENEMIPTKGMENKGSQKPAETKKAPAQKPAPSKGAAKGKR